MSESNSARLAGALVLFLFVSVECNSQNTVNSSIRFMFYNVENLFDINDDPLTDDYEFTSQGTRHWNYTRYVRKLNSLYKALIASGEWEPPAVIGLCEIENKKVLSDLLNKTYLSKYNYKIIHQDSPDPRGIDVCMLFRDALVKVDTFIYYNINSIESETFLTRNMLYVKLIVYKDTINLFINHWPSRRGGVLAAEPQRKKIAEFLRAKLDSLYFTSARNCNLILMGDFNASPDDEVIKMLTKNYNSGLVMVNLCESVKQGSGSYRYQGKWEIIDQIIISSNFLDGEKNLIATEKNFKIINNEFLLTDDPVYPGKTPYSTWRGFKYQGGFSDHLPVILDLKIRHSALSE